MFIVRSQQMSALALHTFEGEMVFHVGRFFPERFAMMGEPAVRDTVRTAIRVACHHGMMMKREVCLYLNCMLVLGSGFDRDPKFGWAGAILHGEGTSGPAKRMTRVNDRMLELAKAWQPGTMPGLLESLTVLESNSMVVMDGRTDLTVRMIAEHLADAFPAPAGMFTPNDLNALAELGQAKAGEYGLNSALDRVLCTSLMYLLGADFDTDPQFPWNRTALARPVGTSTDERLREALRGTLQHVQQAVEMGNIRYT